MHMGCTRLNPIMGSFDKRFHGFGFILFTELMGQYTLSTRSGKQSKACRKINVIYLPKYPSTSTVNEGIEKM
jgi:hypothetical protein